MTEKNLAVVIIIAIAVLVAVAIAAYYIIRFMRGNIKLNLPRTAFNAGESISGSFELLTKKPIQGKRLVVQLIGKEVTRYRENGKSRTRKREIYRDEVLIEGAKAYPGGTLETYPFEIATPDLQSPEFLNSTLGQALTTAMQFIGGRSTRIEWNLEARLDAVGVDLADSQSISLNTAQGL